MTPRKSFTTKAGTELPIISPKGKEYLEVKYRLVWFREEHPTWGIETDFPTVSEKSATAKAVIKDETGRVIATSHKTENYADFKDGHLEKAETGAIGRALALIGYGTQFCADELDEGERIVDSPVPPKGKPDLKAVKADESLAYDPGKYVVKFGKKFKGMKLEDCDIYELNSFHQWLKEQSSGPKGLSDDAHQAYVNIGQYLDMRERPASLEGK